MDLVVLMSEEVGVVVGKPFSLRCSGVVCRCEMTVIDFVGGCEVDLSEVACCTEL